MHFRDLEVNEDLSQRKKKQQAIFEAQVGLI